MVSHVDNFWTKVDKSGDCWEWTAYVDRHGYGGVKFDGKVQRAHRVAMILSGIEIPEGMCVLHACDNRICCNPDHLWLGSHAENNTDRNHKGRSWAKLCELDVWLIRELAKTKTHKAIAEWFDVNRLTIGRAVNRKTWAHVKD